MDIPEDKPKSPEIIHSNYEEEEKVLFSCPIVSNVVPKRGIMWHIAFTLIFIISSALIIYFGEWALLFFLVVASGYSLWRGHDGKEMTFTVDTIGVKINQRRLQYKNIDNFFFGEFGDHKNINFFLTKKYLPRLSYMFVNSDDVEKVRESLQDRVPETEEIFEGWSDFIVRKLKI